MNEMNFITFCSATCAPSMKLMFVGLSGRGKTTLLNSLRFAGKVKTRPITIRERLDSGSNMEFSGMYKVYCKACFGDVQI